MALTRNFLKSMGLTDEQVSAIIENHSDTVEGLKKELASAKAAAEAAESVAKERDELKDKLSKAGDSAKVQADFDAYKKQVEAEKANVQKSRAYDALLKEVGVARDSFRQMLCKNLDVKEIELDERGGIKDAEALKERLRADYADFISTVEDKGTTKVNPPAGGKTYTREQLRKMTPEEINKNWDSIKGNLASLK